jgi:lipopolysaccharide biosynthesis regulator YciM
MKKRVWLIWILGVALVALVSLFVADHRQQLSQPVRFLLLDWTILQLWSISLLTMLLATALLYAFKRLGDKKTLRLYAEDKKRRDAEANQRRDLENLIQAGRFLEALNLLEKASMSPGVLALMRGKCHQGLDNGEEAAKKFQTSWEQGHLEGGFGLVNLLLAQGKEDQAGKVLDRILENMPDNPRALEQRIELAERKGNWETALSLLRRAGKGAHPSHPEREAAFLYEHLNSMFRVSRMGKREMEDLAKLVKEQPSFVPAQILLSDVHFENGEHRKAIAVLEKGFESQGHTEYLVRLESYYLSQGRPEEVLSIYRQMLARKNDPIVRLQMGRFYRQLEMPDELIACLEPMEAEFGTRLGLAILLADARARRSRHSEAFSGLRKALEAHQEKWGMYRCSSCRTLHARWLSRCSSCRQWNKVELDLLNSNAKQESFSPYYF